MDFNFQAFLSEMRREQREDMKTVHSKLDTVIHNQTVQETRIAKLESDVKLAKGTVAMGIIALVGSFWALFKEYIHGLLFR